MQLLNILNWMEKIQDCRVHDDYFQSVAKGQEFVFAEDPIVTDWVRSLFDL